MQEKNSPRSNKVRTEATRAALIKTAKTLFAEKGYGDTSTPEIVKATGLTRGALYHHFKDKEAIFRAVVTDEYMAVADAINQSADATNGSALDAIKQGGRGYLCAMNNPGRARIMLLDGPAVLGQLELDKIDQETSAGTLRMGLHEAMLAGEIRNMPIDALTAQLSAMFDRAALAVSMGEDMEDHLNVLDVLLEGLKA